MEDGLYATTREQIIKALRMSGSAHLLVHLLLGTPKSIWPNIRVRSTETMPTLHAMCAFAHGVFLANKEAGAKLFDTLIRSLNVLDAVGKNSSGVALISTDGPYSIYFIAGSLTNDPSVPELSFYDMLTYKEDTMRIARAMNGAAILFGMDRASEGDVCALEWSVHT